MGDAGAQVGADIASRASTPSRRARTMTAHMSLKHKEALGFKGFFQLCPERELNPYACINRH